MQLFSGWMGHAELARPQEVAAVVDELQDWQISAIATEHTSVHDGVKLLDEIPFGRAVLAASRVPVALPASKGQSEITLDFKQATELLEMFGGEPSTVTLAPGDGHSGKGLYAYWSEIPEEGAIYLGVTDDEAVPVAEVPCEDCNGRGVVGEPRYQGEFQPPEHDRCDSCGGSGKWKITNAAEQGDAKDAARFVCFAQALLKNDQAFLDILESQPGEPQTLDDVRAGIDAAILTSKATAAGEGK